MSPRAPEDSSGPPTIPAMPVTRRPWRPFSFAGRLEKVTRMQISLLRQLEWLFPGITATGFHAQRCQGLSSSRRSSTTPSDMLMRRSTGSMLIVRLRSCGTKIFRPVPSDHSRLNRPRRMGTVPTQAVPGERVSRARSAASRRAPIPRGSVHPRS